MNRSKYYFSRKKESPKPISTEEVKPISLIEELKEIFSGSSTTVEISFEDKDGTDIEINDIKINLPKLSKYYVLLFSQFRKNFNELDNQKVKELITKNEVYSSKIINLLNPIYDSVYARQVAENELITYVQNNYYDILDFFDLCVEVFDIQ